MKLKNIESLLIGLKELYEKELSMSTSYSIVKNIQSVEEEYKIITDKRNELVNKYGVKDKNGELVTLENGNIKLNDVESFAKDLDELMEIDSTISLIKIKFNNLSGIKLSPKAIMFLEPILIHEEDEK